MKQFNVIIEDINRSDFTSYDIIPYLVSRYKEAEDKPKTFEEFKKFIISEAKYQWWGRCQYEIILSAWPPKQGFEKKIDVYEQVMMNIDIVTNLVMESI